MHDTDRTVPLPASSFPNSCYCEENVWHLAAALAARPLPGWQLFVIFVSNASKSVREGWPCGGGGMQGRSARQEAPLARPCPTLPRAPLPALLPPQVPLWRQRAACSPGAATLWDYHVLVLAAKAGQAALVLDLDT